MSIARISYKKFFVFLVTANLFLSCSVDESVEQESTTYAVYQTQVVYEKNQVYENNLFEELNAYLLSINQSPLILNFEANQVAFEHTKHLIESNAVHHENFSERQNYFYSLGFTSVRENVAMGIDNATHLIQAWLQSPSHRQAIEANSSCTGISVLKNDKGVYFITQIYLK